MEKGRNEKKYDYTSLESQLLLQEMAKIMAEITKHNRMLEERILSLELELEKRGRVRFMVKEISRKANLFMRRNLQKLLKKQN